MDLPSWMDGSQIVLHIHEDQPDCETIVLSAAGMIGLCGMSSRGLAVCVNTLSQLPPSPCGLPVAFVTRQLLTHDSLATAVDFLTHIDHASGQNYIVGDRDGIVDYECPGSESRRTIPSRGNDRLVWHTNHPLAGRDTTRAEVSKSPLTTSSLRRMAVLDRRLSGPAGPLDRNALVELLGSREDPEYPIAVAHGKGDSIFTFGSVTWQIGSRCEAHVGFTAPCYGPMREIVLEEPAPNRRRSAAGG
jgi:hypothetical protein